jgi:hypothetical protein
MRSFLKNHRKGENNEKHYHVNDKSIIHQIISKSKRKIKTAAGISPAAGCNFNYIVVRKNLRVKRIAIAVITISFLEYLPVARVIRT